MIVVIPCSHVMQVAKNIHMFIYVCLYVNVYIYISLSLSLPVFLSLPPPPRRPGLQQHKHHLRNSLSSAHFPRPFKVEWAPGAALEDFTVHLNRTIGCLLAAHGFCLCPLRLCSRTTSH